jgi:hypothetical protein
MNNAWKQYFNLIYNLECQNTKKANRQLLKLKQHMQNQLEKFGIDKLEFKKQEQLFKDKQLPIKLPSKKTKTKKYNKHKLKLWKQLVLERDNYTCQECNSKINLHAHHIQSKSSHINLCYDVDNGITLCNLCHRKKHPTLPDKFFFV